MNSHQRSAIEAQQRKADEQRAKLQAALASPKYAAQVQAIRAAIRNQVTNFPLPLTTDSTTLAPSAEASGDGAQVQRNTIETGTP